MKTTLLFLLISVIGFSQTNFKTKNQQLYWQKVYDYNDITILDAHLKSNSFTSNLDITNNINSVISNPGKLKEEKLPTYAHRNFFAYIKIDLRENKYRVTISEITFTGIGIEWVEGVSEDSNTLLDVHALEKNEIKKDKATTITLNNLDKFFNKTFILTDRSVW
ncbi:MAG: hypothetical protein ABFR05_02190 [Bacteroidota bacterium]